MSKTRFVVIFGILGWGVLCGVLFALWMSASRETSLLLWLSISLPVGCIGGYAFGLLLWRRLRAGS